MRPRSGCCSRCSSSGEIEPSSIGFYRDGTIECKRGFVDKKKSQLVAKI